MRKSLIVASSALLLAVGAAAPGGPKLGYDLSAFEGVGGPYEEVTASAGGKVQASYRPCRPGPGDDRCIQLYERRVRAALAGRARSRPPAPRQVELPAMGGPIEGRADYPLCSTTLTDECIQHFDRAPARGRRAPPREGASTPGI